MLCIPIGTKIDIVEKEYPDIWKSECEEDHDRYWIGHSDEEDEESFVWLSYDEAVEFCGFCEGAIEEAETLIDGNGPWAQGMISRRGFDGYAMSDTEKSSRLAISKIYWDAHKRGASRKSNDKMTDGRKPVLVHRLVSIF